jgi:hypothetical protein
MSDDSKSGVLSGLPRRRPHRRSDKRDAPKPRPANGSSWPPSRPVPELTPPLRLRQPAQPDGAPDMPRASEPARARSFSSASGAEILGTAVQAAAELAEIGLSAGARALRNAVSRLPRP